MYGCKSKNISILQHFSTIRTHKLNIFQMGKTETDGLITPCSDIINPKICKSVKWKMYKKQPPNKFTVVLVSGS